MAEIIDLTVSPRLEIIEISSDTENASPARLGRTQGNKRRKRKRGKTSNGLASDTGIGTSCQSSRAHSPETKSKHNDVNDPSTSPPKSAPQAIHSISSPTINEPGLFFFDAVAAPIAVDDVSSTPETTKFSKDGTQLLLPSHVAIFDATDDEPIPTEVIPPPKVSLDDEGYIEYLDYEDRKAPGLVRYFETEGEETNQSRLSVFKCKNCGAEGDHKTYECPVQICLTCGARDEHSTRSCPIGKTCYTCGMKGHINKTCPNRFSAHVASSGFHDDCGRCGSTEHKMNECPTLWRIYRYVNDEERIVITQSREDKKRLAIGQGGEGYIGMEMWCYNCANTGHLGDDCDELLHPATFPMESSAFSSRNVMSGPFYDPAAEPVPVKRGQRALENRIDWDAGAPADVGKRGKNKDKERLEKRFREQEDDETEDWFNDIQNVKRRETGRQVPTPGPRGRAPRFGLIKDGEWQRTSPPPSSPTKGNGSSLLARLSDHCGGRDGEDGDRSRRYQTGNSLRIRGAATGRDGRCASLRETDCERGLDRWDRGSSKRGRGREGSTRRRGWHGPRYRGGYDVL